MVSLTRALAAAITPVKAMSSVPGGGGWWGIVRESFGGAWQRNVTVNRQEVLSYNAVFACMTLIASDIAKLRVKLMKQSAAGIWSETSNASYSPVLRKPNPFQTRIQFWENWILSKLSRGNTYVLKQRDNRNVVRRLYVLDPTRVMPMVADDGAVWYQLSNDDLAQISETSIYVPASEIIHDRFNCLFHPLVGLSPIYACGLAATQGLRIQNNSTHFFGNAANPGGLLIAPGKIDPENAKRLKESWETGFTGENAGKIAVLGDNLKYQALSVNPIDAQLIEQLKWTAEVVCSTFHVPPYKIGVGQMPTFDNIQSLNIEYYSQCLQILIESAEVLLDEGLGTGDRLGTEFDLDNLLRMDSKAMMEVLEKGKGVMSPDEMRRRIDLPPVPGGAAVYLQQQNYSLAALAKRDAQDDPFGKAPAADTAPAPAAADAGTAAGDAAANDNAMALEAARALLAVMRGLA